MPDLKSLFATPKKAALTAACILVMLATLGAACALAAGAFGRGPAGEDVQNSPPAGEEPQPPEESPEASRPGGLVLSKSLEEAREIALADAGLTASGAVFTGETLREDNGLWVYSFHFQAGDTTCAYEINANTGAVYSKVIRTCAAPTPAPGPTPTPEPTPTRGPESTPAPGADGGASPGPGEPDGLQEGTLPPDAVPGMVPGVNPGMETGSAYIGVARAREIALEHAGLTASQVMVTRAAMDRDDGRMVYEIEFRRNGVEYEYEIDAQSGAILEYEADRD